ncbi:hypothetical protein EB118_14445 [bacterium]|nr:hypothetical protein [bacterium]NBX97370.1 hypothetical protein [bacterium]NDC94281.1 hypothetical protein [bacterium]NDD84392.1 hypothetical protein [bacterium]NDG31255.1 hypothetical protein [bacterium]
MIQQDVLKKIRSFNHSDFEILSVYLGSEDRRAPSSELLLTQFHSLVHSYLTKLQRVIFAADIKRIQDYINKLLPSSRSFVFFSAGEKLWQPLQFEFYLEQKLVVATSPILKPIEEALEQYSRYLVLLVDREKVRMFTVEQGEMVDCSVYFAGYVPQLKKSSGRDIGDARSDIEFRHNETLLRRHIELSAQEVARFTKDQNVRFVILGGHSEMFKKVSKSLPAGLRTKILDQFVTDVNIPLNEIMLESKQIAASLAVF